jgi:hypothetical protein
VSTPYWFTGSDLEAVPPARPSFSDPDDARMRHFRALTHEEQQAAIRRLIERGFGDHSIAQATCASVEQIRSIRRSATRTPVRHDGTIAPCSAFSSDTRS